MSKNDVTGDEIVSKSLSCQGRGNWDKIYATKTPQEWLDQFHPQLKILDWDGWRQNDGVTKDTPISYQEFQKRLSYSTTLGYICDPEKKVNATLID